MTAAPWFVQCIYFGGLCVVGCGAAALAEMFLLRRDRRRFGPASPQHNVGGSPRRQAVPPGPTASRVENRRGDAGRARLRLVEPDREYLAAFDQEERDGPADNWGAW